MANKNELIDLLANNEELLSRLYKIYSQKIPAYSDFWLRLSDDERMHASKIKEFAQSENVQIDTTVIKKTDLVSFAKDIKKAIEDAESDIDLKDALKRALSFENNLADKRFFSVFSSESSEMQFYINEIEESINKHRKRIEKMIEKAK